MYLRDCCVKYGRLRWINYVVRIEKQERNTEYLVKELYGKRHLLGPRRRWDVKLK